MMNALSHLADVLDTMGLTWALGGSWVLYRVGALKQPRDVDVVATGLSATELKERLDQLGPIRIKEKSPLFSTVVGYEFDFEGLEVDLLLDFGVNTEKGSVVLDLEREKPFQMVRAGNREIPVCSLETWHIFYLLMGDPKQRVPMIESCYPNVGIDRERLTFYAEQLPEADACKLKSSFCL